MTVVFCRCSAAEFASIRYTGRRASDTPGRLQNSAMLKRARPTTRTENHDDECYLSFRSGLADPFLRVPGFNVR